MITTRTEKIQIVPRLAASAAALTAVSFIVHVMVVAKAVGQTHFASGAVGMHRWPCLHETY